MDEIKTVVLDNLSDLIGIRFQEPTNVVITGNNDKWWRCVGLILICNRNIASLKVEIPGIYRTSDDGKFLFAKNPETNNQLLVGYFGHDSSVVVPDGVHEIYTRAFEDNPYIESVCLPKSIRIIAERAFQNCANLERINFPDGLTQIGAYAFHDTSITEAAFPASLSMIGRGAFKQCSELETVVFANNSKMETFQDVFEDCERLSKFILPDHLQRISPYCFHRCPNFKEIHLPATVSLLETGTFVNVQDMYIEKLPDGLIQSLVSANNNYNVDKWHTFTIHFKGSNFVFPRDMDPYKFLKAENMIRKTKQKSDVAGFSLAAEKSGKALTAFEALRRYHIKDAKEYLKNHSQYLLALVNTMMKPEEEMMNDILNVFDGEGMLTYEFLEFAKSISVSHSWLGVTAYIINLINKSENSDISFDL